VSKSKNVALPAYIWVKVVGAGDKPIDVDCPDVAEPKDSSRPPRLLEVDASLMSSEDGKAKPAFKLEFMPCFPFDSDQAAKDWAAKNSAWFVGAASFHLVEVERL
jgi:hypothetical protein